MSAVELKPLFTWRSAITEPDSGLRPNERLVALVLSLHMSEKGDSCMPGTITLASESALSKPTIIASLRLLEARGWLVTTSQGGGRGHRKAYRAALPSLMAERVNVADRYGRKGSIPVGERVKKATIKGKATSVLTCDDAQQDVVLEDVVLEDVNLAPLAHSLVPGSVTAWWNETLGDVLAEAKASNGTRGKHITARCRIAGRDESWWRFLFAEVRQSPFLLGDNERGWKATIDFVVKSEDNVNKILEGAYRNSQAKRGGRASVGDAWDEIRRRIDDTRRVGTDQQDAVLSLPAAQHQP